MSARRIRGVSLLEVLIALFVVTVGLLGVAKMQALALANTRGSSTRSLVSIEVSGLASAMHANRLYWQAVTGIASPFTVSIAAGAVTSANTSDSNLTSSTTCAGTVCTSATGVKMAAYDVNVWAQNLNSLVSGATATVACTGTTPVTCTITVNWTENVVGANQGVNLSSGTAVTPTGNQTLANSYEMLVQP